MKKSFLVSLLFLIPINLIATTITAQSPYKLNLKRDNILVISGVSSMLLGLYSVHKMTSLTIDEIKHLSKSDINSFDRPAISYWSTGAQQFSDLLLVSYGILPATLFLSKKVRKDVCTISTMIMETTLLTIGMNYISKGLFQRIRPFVYNSNPDIPIDEKTKPDAKRSFYSGHTTEAFAFAVFTATVFSNYFPDSKWKITVWSASLLGASSMAVLRVKGGKHFYTDVLVGAVMGSLTGYIIPYLHRQKNGSQLSIVPAYDCTQLQISFNFKL